MKHINLKDVLSHVEELPALSSIFTELLNSIDQEYIDIESIAKKISLDQVLTVKTLRLANSSFYGMQNKVSSIHEAILILGFSNIRAMIATSAIIGNFFNGKKKQHHYFPTFWRHSIGTAICANEIANIIGSQKEYAFIAGLIHDIGKLILATQYPEEYEQVMQYQIANSCDSLTAEQQILGIDHGEIGHAVARHWKFPEVMQLVTYEHHPQTGQVMSDLAGLVHLADIIAIGLNLSNDENAVVPVISAAVWEKIQLNDTDCQRICINTYKKFTDIVPILLT